MREQTRRRLGAITALAVVAGTALTACDSAASSVGSVSVLTSFSDAEGAAFDKVLDRFTEKYHIPVKSLYTRALSQVLRSAVQNGTPPDIAVIPSPAEVAQYVGSGALRELDDIPGLTAEGAATPQWQQLQRMGRTHLYSITVKTELKSLVWYNPKAFHEEPPRTWDELMALSFRLRAAGATPWCVGLGDPPSSGWPGTDWIEDILLHQSGSITYENWAAGRLPWTSDEMRNAWVTWGRIAVAPGMIHGGTLGATLTDFADAGRPMFNDPPQCLLHRQASFMIGSYLGYKDRDGAGLGLKPGVDFDFFPFPQFAGSPAATTPVWEVSADLAGMFNSTPQARKLMEFLATDEAQRIWPATSGGSAFSANRRVAESENHLVSARIARTLTAPDAVLCFDASDVMPKPMTNAFYQAVLQYLANPNGLETLLAQLDHVRAGIAAGDWLQLPCGRR